MRKAALLLVLIMLLTACQPKPTPKIAEVTVPVEITVLVTRPPEKPIAVTVLVTQPPLPTHTPYPTYTPYPTHTSPPAPTAAPVLTDTPVPTDTPIPPTDTPLPPTDTPVPIATPSPTPTVCPILPEGGFLTIWQSYPDLQTALGCPTSYHPRVMPAAWEVKTSYQPFERGEMIWSDHIGWYAQPVVYVLYDSSTYQRFDDTFDRV